MQKLLVTLAASALFILFTLPAMGQHATPWRGYFVDIPGDGEDIAPFKMGITEITNQQYVNFLNAALRENKISVGPVELLDMESADPEIPAFYLDKMRNYKSKYQQLVYDEDGHRILNLLNIRAVYDHNDDGEVQLWEVKNPLSRCWIEYDSRKKKFRVVNPRKVDWNMYFNEDNLPEGIEVHDSITNWAELHKFWPKGVTLRDKLNNPDVEISTWARADWEDFDENVLFAGHHDLDFKLPSLGEIKNWPVNFIEYYAAKAFADFYGYDLPTSEEVRWAAAGGMGYEYGTDDGTMNDNNAVYEGHSRSEYPPGKINWPGNHKGHVQPVASFAPNPYGVYDLSGNVTEWTKSENPHGPGECRLRDVIAGFELHNFTGGSWYYAWESASLSVECLPETAISVTNDHFGFRVVKRRQSSVEFVSIPGDGEDIAPFKMSITEITNQQYVDFLNAALRENKISVGPVELLDETSEPVPPELYVIKMRDSKSRFQQLVYDEDGNRILNLLRRRAISDHSRDNGKERWEMKNPLNRCWIEYNSRRKKFNVVNPKKVDWNIYFDDYYLPEGVTPAADSITNWAELHKFWPDREKLRERLADPSVVISSWVRGDYDERSLFAGHLDLDFKLPTLKEVKNWPVNYIEYLSAKAFADFYGYDLPTVEEMQWAAMGGQGNEFGTDDGTINVGNTVYTGKTYADDYPVGGPWPGQHKGHVQPVASFAPNPYGVYDLSGNLSAWTKSKNGPGCPNKGDNAHIFIGGSWTYSAEAASFFVNARGCFPEADGAVTNDHWGLRVVKKE